MALFKRGGVWWYKFYFAGQPIRESSKSTSKTVAKNAEQQRRRELETGFHNIREVRQHRIRYLRDVIDEYWKRQWAIIDPHVEPVEISSNGEGGSRCQSSSGGA
jgi:hypothetical protein